MAFPSLGIIFKKLSPTLPKLFHKSLKALPIFLLVSNLKFSNLLIALFLSFILFSLNSIKLDLILVTGLKTLSLNEQISLIGYPTGIYLVKLRLDNGPVFTKRIIKTNQ